MIINLTEPTVLPQIQGHGKASDAMHEHPLRILSARHNTRRFFTNHGSLLAILPLYNCTTTRKFKLCNAIWCTGNLKILPPWLFTTYGGVRHAQLCNLHANAGEQLLAYHWGGNQWLNNALGGRQAFQNQIALCSHVTYMYFHYRHCYHFPQHFGPYC